MTVTDTVRRGPVKKDRAVPVRRTVTRRSAAGKDLGKVDLEPTIFGIEPNLAVLHQVVTAQLAAARSGTQSTKTRAEVRGGGAKPFSQKGTGRARQGSSRSPSMSGGGVALGPKPRSYRQHTPKKMVRLALLSALSDRAARDRVALVDAWGWDTPSTKDAVAALRKLRISGRVLVVLAHDETAVRRSFANLPDAQATSFGELSAHDVLRNEWILFSDRTLPGSPETFSTGLDAGPAEGEATGDVTAAGEATDDVTDAADAADDADTADAADAADAADEATEEATPDA
ncbi:MAG: 50S ribosomal protein L4 [Acidimicrobiales bacterium]